MNITIVPASGGPGVTAPAERWLCALIALLDDGQRQRLLDLVASRVELARVPGHVIGVPSIVTGERFGRV